MRQIRNIRETKFSKWLNDYLLTSGLDLTAVAAAASISQGYLSMLRYGRRKSPSRDVVMALELTLGAPQGEGLKAAGYRLEIPTTNLNIYPTKKTKIPLALLKFSRSYYLSDEETKMLSLINHRGQQPKNEEQWLGLWLAIKAFCGQP